MLLARVAAWLVGAAVTAAAAGSKSPPSFVRCDTTPIAFSRSARLLIWFLLLVSSYLAGCPD